MARYPQRNSSSLFKVLVFHPVLWFSAASICTIVLAISLWNRYQHEIVDQADFGLTAEKIQLTHPEPNWVRTPISEIVLNQDAQPNLLSHNLVNDTANLIKSVGWVENINSITKSKNGLQLDLTYRNPVALVLFPNENNTIPIDKAGRLIDQHITLPAMIEHLPRIHVFRPQQDNLHTWAAWPDSRIQSAARLAGYLGNSWVPFGFYQIVTFQAPGNPNKPPRFELYPKNGTVVIWGAAPGQEVAGEASAEAKFKALAEHVLRNGSFENTDPNLMLDLRTGKLVETRKIRTAISDEMSSGLK